MKGEYMGKKEEKNAEIAKKMMEGCYEKAEDVLKDKDKFEYYIQKFEQKMADTAVFKQYPIARDVATAIPDMISMIKARVSGEYKNIPVGQSILCVAAIVYAVSPIDIIPDAVPVAGWLDDAGFLTAAVGNLLKGDIEDYKKWRVENGKDINSSMEQVEKGLQKKPGLKERKEQAALLKKENKALDIKEVVSTKGKEMSPQI